ncbi:L-lactate permease [Nocardiopsis sp. RV163]|uniref:L-lactate permease n=1 Tax=Nocardiopsis sp. RV163 TaxID=1661388 RepID=UPI00064BB951
MDNLALLGLLALAPIVLVGVLLVGFRLPAVYAMPAGYVVVVTVAVLFWRTDWVAIAASTLQGLILAIGLLYIPSSSSPQPNASASRPRPSWPPRPWAAPRAT